MAKEKIMNTTQLEIKAIAKAAGASLTRAGHKVPHNALLHALSTALNKRNWQTVKAALDGTEAPPTFYLSDEEEFEILRESERLYAEDNGGASITGHIVALTQRRFAKANSMREPVAAKLDSGDAAEALAGNVDVLKGSTPSTASLLIPRVGAKFWTDDRVFEVEFDATPYLAQADESELTAIIEAGFSGDESTDAVGLYMADRNRNEDLVEAFGYLNHLQKSGRKDAPGFEVALDSEQFLTWMDKHHPGALAEVLCARDGILLRRLKEVETDNDWTWEEIANGEILQDSDDLFLTRREAALDAYRKKELLALAIDGHI